MAELSTARGRTPTPIIGLGARALSNFPMMYVVGKALSGLAIVSGKAGTELPETTTDTATGRAYLKTSTGSAGSKPFFLTLAILCTYHVEKTVEKAFRGAVFIQLEIS